MYICISMDGWRHLHISAWHKNHFVAILSYRRYFLLSIILFTGTSIYRFSGPRHPTVVVRATVLVAYHVVKYLHSHEARTSICARSANEMQSLIGRFMGPTWGPSGADRSQVGPMGAQWTLLSGMTWTEHQSGQCFDFKLFCWNARIAPVWFNVHYRYSCEMLLGSC